MKATKFLLGAGFLYALLTSAASHAQTLGRSLALSEAPVTGSQRYKEAVSNLFKGNEPKIVGGKVAAKNAYPWQVSFGVSWIADPYAAHFCGGTILSDKWIVSAAHCLVGVYTRAPNYETWLSACMTDSANCK